MEEHGSAPRPKGGPDAFESGDTHAVDRKASGPRSAAAASRRPVEIGEILSDKYLVEEVIGEGGVGIVVAAHHLELDERVALKFLRADVMDDADIVARFAHEAKAAVSIKSEYVARVFDVGTTPKGVPFLVMEYLAGHDLSTELHAKGTLGIKDAVEHAMQACEGLAAAHAKGVVHRDIKPENLFLLGRGGSTPVIKVLDFGISKAALTGSLFRGPLPTLKSGKLMGTPLYMSPEQIRSTDDVDARTDIWSLGMVLYELLVGTPAFQGATLEELCKRILEAKAPLVTTPRADVPPGLAAVIDRCLKKDPADRFQNVAELAIGLLPFAPKRARLCAERACSILGAAGLTSATLRVVSTVPPPHDAAPQGQTWETRIPREPNAVASPVDALGTGGTTFITAAKPRSARVALAVGAVACLAVLGAAFALASHPKATPKADAIAVHATDEQAKPAPQGTTAPSQAAASAPAEATPTRALPTETNGPRPVRVESKPAPLRRSGPTQMKTPAAVSTQGPATPAAKPTSDEPDLGY